MRVVEQPVKDGSGQDLVTEHLPPFTEAVVGTS